MNQRNDSSALYRENVHKSWKLMAYVVSHVEDECFVAHLEPNSGVGYDCLSLITRDTNGNLRVRFMLNRNGVNANVLDRVWQSFDDEGCDVVAQKLIEASGLSIAHPSLKSAVAGLCEEVVGWIEEHRDEEFCVGPIGWPRGCRSLLDIQQKTVPESAWPIPDHGPELCLGVGGVETVRLYQGVHSAATSLKDVSVKPDRVREICDALKGESIFQLSLHSKELFHSNVIAWFCEAFPVEAVRVVAHWVPERDTSVHRIQREHKNLDLVIELPGLAPVILENKVFSPPDEQQLDDYAKKKLPEIIDPTRILLSLGAPNWLDSLYTSTTGAVWKYVSYRQLGTALREAVQDISGFDGDLLRRYVKFIDLLQELADVIGNPGTDDPVEVNDETNLILKTVRLHDAIGKLRTRSAVASIERTLMEDVGLGEIIFKADFTHSQPLMEAFVQRENGDSIGWQLQGKQWRLAIKTAVHVGETSDLRDRRYAYAEQVYADWFDFSEIQELIGRTVSVNSSKEKKGTFTGYQPDFVYRYRNLPGLTLKELEILSKHYLSRAANWLR
jgi:hypothetical protein